MLSKRNFAMMMIMNLVVLVLFLFSVVLKEYFNDYDVNHAAETEWIDKTDQKMDEDGNPDTGWDALPAKQNVLYIGTADNFSAASFGFFSTNCPSIRRYGFFSPCI